MIRFLTFTIITLSSVFSFAQDVDSVALYIKTGVTLHDQGSYNTAISNYDKALKIEPKNITALTEKAYSQYMLGDYQGAVETCQFAEQNNVRSEDLRVLYTNYANAYDALEMPEKAIEVYEKAISIYPDYYHLYFNKAITLSSLKKMDEAMEAFQKAAILNPDHASSHNGAGRVAAIQYNKIAAVLALCRFMVIEPQGDRASLNLNLIKDLLMGDVKKTGKNSITINIDAFSLPDSTEETQPNDFSTIEFTMSMSSALDFDKKNKKKTEAELYVGKFESMCSMLEELKSENFGFFWEYYAPYFISMKENNMIETFTYICFASSEDKDVASWLEKNKDAITKFYRWSSNYQWELK